MAGHRENRVSFVPSGSYREVIQVAWPIVVSMLSYTTMGVADAFFVAKLGVSEVASVGIGVTASFTLGAFGWGLMNAVKVVVAQAHGAGSSHRAQQVPFQGLGLAMLIGSIVMALVPLSSGIILSLGATGDVHTLATEYLRVRLLGVLPMYLSIAAFGYFQGLGDTRTPMRVQVSANALNIVLDAVLIFGLGPFPALGVEGAAIGTVISFVVQAVASVWLLIRATSERGQLRVEGTREILRLGVPMGVRFWLEVMSWAVFTRFVAQMGEVHLAAHTIAIRIISISFLPGHGIGEAASVLTGQAVGARREDVARRAAHAATVLCLSVMGVLGVVFLFFGADLMALFRGDPEVLQIGGPLMVIAAGFQIFDGIAMVKTGALNGAGDTKYVMFVSITASWLVLLPLGYGLCNVVGWGVVGAWLALTLQIVVVAVIFSRRWAGPTAIQAGVARAPV